MTQRELMLKVAEATWGRCFDHLNTQRDVRLVNLQLVVDRVLAEHPAALANAEQAIASPADVQEKVDDEMILADVDLAGDIRAQINDGARRAGEVEERLLPELRRQAATIWGGDDLRVDVAMTAYGYKHPMVIVDAPDRQGDLDERDYPDIRVFSTCHGPTAMLRAAEAALRVLAAATPAELIRARSQEKK